MPRARLHSRFAKWVGLTLLSLSGPVLAADFGLKLEPGLAVPLTQPQSQLFKVGGSGSLRALLGLTTYLDLGAGVTFVGLPASDTAPDGRMGNAWGFGGGLRLKRPHDAERFLGASPWIDADALFVRTGEMSRFGFDAGIGLAFPLNDSRTLWLGPFARYFQILQPSSTASDNRDAKILIFGASFEFGSNPAKSSSEEVTPVAPRTEVPPPAAPPPAVAPVATPEPDRDHDGVPDKDDLCPDVPGPVENRGCPVYEKVVVKPDRLELKEKIQFAPNSAIIKSESHPLLNDVAKALQENKSFRVEIRGHASSDGPQSLNQKLSEQRAKSVRDYLVRNGIEADALPYKGLGSSQPIDSNETQSGREANRRVEFIVQEKGGIR